MALFLWKGPKPVVPLSDDAMGELSEQYSDFAGDGGIRGEQIELAVVDILSTRIGPQFTPETYALFIQWADEIAAMLANDVFLSLSDDALGTAVAVYFTAQMRAVGLESPGFYGVTNIVLLMVASSVALGQFGRGIANPTQVDIERFRATVAEYLAEQHNTLPREHAAPILAALALASATHPQATKIFTGGVPEDPLPAGTVRTS